MTYKQQVVFRFGLATILAIIGYGLIWLLAFYLFNIVLERYFTFTSKELTIIKLSYYVLISISYVTAWCFRGIYVVSIETCIARMSLAAMKVTKDMLEDEIKKQEDKDVEKKNQISINKRNK